MKHIKRILIALLVIILALALTIFVVWRNEISTLMSFEQVRQRNDAHLDGSVYTMHVKGDFYLDEFIAQGGVKSDSELIDFIVAKITKGVIPINISNPEIGCSSFTATTQDGDVLFGRNYDFSKTNTLIVTTEANEGRHASISSVDLQFLGIDVNSDVNGMMDQIICLAAPYAPLDGSVYTMHVKGDFYLDEFIAQGGVNNDSELIDFIVAKITKGVIPINISNPEIGCSSFMATTEDGDVLFGRNYDFSKTNTLIVTTEANEGRHASISSVDLQFLGIDVNSDVNGMMDQIICLAAPYAPLDGINDAGVSCGIYMTYQGGEKTVATDQNTDKPDFTSTTLLRLILDYADDVDEAVEIAQSYDLHDSAGTSYHYMVADASGRSVILEWVGDSDATDNDGSARKLVVHYNDVDEYVGQWEAESNFQWVTNFIVNPGYYDESAPEEMKGYDRYERIYQELNATGGIVADEQAAMDILAIVGRRSWNNDDGNGCTVHSVVYNLTDKTAMWVSNENYDDPTAIFHLSIGE